MAERPFHYGFWKAVAEALSRRHDRSRLAPGYTESKTDKHSRTTYYGGMIGDRIKGCLYREDGTRALYSRTVTGRVPREFEVVDAVLRNNEVKLRHARKTARRTTTPPADASREHIHRPNSPGKPSVR